MADLKPARHYIARAVEARDGSGGFHALWAAPGMEPRFVEFGDEPATYPTARAAENAARKILFDALNARTVRDSVKARRTLMTPEEFAHALGGTDITTQDFAHIIGTRSERVQEMRQGLRPVPFYLWWALDFLSEPGAADRAYEIAMDHTNLEIEEEPAS